MREMTEFDASRGSSVLLDLVERGESVVVTRAGRRVAMIQPASTANGVLVQEVFDRWRTSEALDEEFLDTVRSVAEAASEDDDADSRVGFGELPGVEVRIVGD